MTVKKTYADTVDLHCTDKNETVTAEILEFRPNILISVSIQRKIKMMLKFNPRSNNYVGSMAGLEFTTAGPKETITYEGRK
jgi:hypothetical protein